MTIPLSFRWTLRLAWEEYLTRFDVILLGHLCLSLPLNFIADLWIYQKINNTDQLLQYVLQHPLVWAVEAFGVLVTLFLNTLVILAIKHTYHRKAPTIKELLHQSVQFFPRVLIVNLVTGISTLLGLLLFILPGLMLWLLFSFTLPALLWYDLQPSQAIRYSWYTVKIYWRTVVIYQLGLQLMLGLITVLFNYLLPTTTGFVTISLTIQAIMSSFATAFTVVLFTILDTKRISESLKQAK